MLETLTRDPPFQSSVTWLLRIFLPLGGHTKSGSAKGLDGEGRGPLRTAPFFLPPLHPLSLAAYTHPEAGLSQVPTLPAHVESLHGGKRSQGQALTPVMGDPK